MHRTVFFPLVVFVFLGISCAGDTGGSNAFDSEEATLATGTTKLTTGAADFKRPSADSRGRHIVYVSGNVLYLYDVKTETSSIIAASGVDDATISSNGKFVAFSSDADPLGTNADGNFEIFRHDVDASTTTQITDTTSGDSEKPSINKKATWIAFISDADLTGSNADGSQELFLYDVAGDAFTQVTSAGTGDSSDNPVILPNGRYVYFDSDADLAGTNTDGNREIFRYAVAAASTQQLTSTTSGDSSRPSPSKSGKFVAFESDSDQLSGANSDGEKEIYRLKISNASLRRITDYAFASTSGCISGNGRYVAFGSSGDPLGSNSDGSSELFLVKVKKTTLDLTQITSGATGTDSTRSVLNNAGKRVFFQSDADLTGAGAGFDHIFVYVR